MNLVFMCLFMTDGNISTCDFSSECRPSIRTARCHSSVSQMEANVWSHRLVYSVQYLISYWATVQIWWWLSKEKCWSGKLFTS